MHASSHTRGPAIPSPLSVFIAVISLAVCRSVEFSMVQRRHPCAISTGVNLVHLFSGALVKLGLSSPERRRISHRSSLHAPIP
jgi:hypothetical protein